MTAVRMKVAKSELTFSTPILAKMAVSAAKAADSSAQSYQEKNVNFMARHGMERMMNRPANTAAIDITTDAST